MAEPNVTTVAVAVPLAVVFTSVFGQMYGIYALILAGAITGSFFALLAAPPVSSRWQAVGLMVRSILLSLLMTAGASHLLSESFGWNADELYIFVSFGIAALGDKWLEIIETLKTTIQTAVTGIFKKGEDK